MRLRRSLGATVAASMVGDPDVLAYADAVVANGGTVSTARYPILTAFVGADKAAGAWDLSDDYWGFWAENAPQALTSLKQRRLATLTAAPAFTTDRGYAFNGTTQCVNTGFSPASHGINCTGDNQRLAAYERTNVNDANTTAGTIDILASRNLILICRNGTAAGARANSGAVTFTLAPADSRALKAVSRTGSTARLYDRGVRLTDVTGLSPGTSPPANTLVVGARNNAGVVDAFRACSIGFVCIGGQLSDAQEAAQYASVQQWATAVGAQV